jgi:hypothetical protein
MSSAAIRNATDVAFKRAGNREKFTRIVDVVASRTAHVTEQV